MGDGECVEARRIRTESQASIPCLRRGSGTVELQAYMQILDRMGTEMMYMGARANVLLFQLL